MEEKSKFDFEAFKKDAIEKLKQGKKINGSDGVFQPLLKHFLEAAMEAEIDVHLNRDERESGNRKNEIVQYFLVLSFFLDPSTSLRINLKRN